MRKLRIALVAGEASGDILGAGLIQSLKERYPDAEFEGIGGSLMEKQGMRLIYPIERLSVMGLVEVLKQLPELLGIRKDLTQRWITTPPDLFIGIDAPDFNLQLEKKLKETGVTTVHYVSPSVWAWKRKRIFKIKECADLLLALFPFEPRYYQETNQRVVCVGHPLADQIERDQSVLSLARDELGYDSHNYVVAILPGSRRSEVDKLLSPFLETARVLYQKESRYRFIIPAANQVLYDKIRDHIRAAFSDLPIQLILKQSQKALAASDTVLIASGTATLEATLLKRPMVVAYKLAPLTHAIYSRMIKSPYISLPNILAGEKLVPELIQNDVQPEQMANLIDQSITDIAYKARLAKAYDRIYKTVRLDADERAAEAVSELVEERLGHAKRV